MSEIDPPALPLKPLAPKVAVALVAVKVAWAGVLFGVGDYDFRHAHTDDLIRLLATFVGVPVHLILAIIVWRGGRNWAVDALLVIAIAGALGAGGSGLLLGLPHALDQNYDRDTAMIPFLSVAIAINVALAVALWRARRDPR